jgi:hypothetical protein
VLLSQRTAGDLRMGWVMADAWRGTSLSNFRLMNISCECNPVLRVDWTPTWTTLSLIPYQQLLVTRFAASTTHGQRSAAPRSSPAWTSSTAGPNREPRSQKVILIGRQRRETVVRLPFAADCCPCVAKLRTELPFSVGIRDGVVQLVPILGGVVSSA